MSRRRIASGNRAAAARLALAVLALAAFALAVGGALSGPTSAATDEVVIHVPLAVDGGPSAGITPPSPTAVSTASATATSSAAPTSAVSPTSTEVPTEGATPTRSTGHHAGEDCMTCHDTFRVAGTVYEDLTGADFLPGVPLSLIAPDGHEIVTSGSNGDGNLADPFVPDGDYLVQLGDVTSKTWHEVPGQSSCNQCHVPGGNASAQRTKQLDTYHSRLPVDNACTHCHHFPETQALEELMTLGVLNPAVDQPDVPGSIVRIGGREFEFDPRDHAIDTVRPDVFAPGYFSMFDAILAVAAANGVEIEYEWDESRATHFISAVDGVERDYWYHFTYDTGSASGNERELAYRRANRWDETLWRPGAWVQLVAGEDLDRLRSEFLDEVDRERRLGHVVPSVRFQINPSQYQGNPPGSGRITVRRELADVAVTAHNLRAVGYPSPHSKPFQPGVVTSLDIVLSLMDQGVLNAATSVFYSNFAGNHIDSYYVVELGFPGLGSAHASGRQGIVYITENGAYNDLPNGADRKLHITADIHVIHAPDFSYWRWIELGDPFYERGGRGGGVDPLIVEDSEALGRGFNLHPPRIVGETGDVELRFNVLEPGRFRLAVRDETGDDIEELYRGPMDNVGVHRLVWPGPSGGASSPDRLYVEMSSAGGSQVRELRAPSTTRDAAHGDAVAPWR